LEGRHLNPVTDSAIYSASEASDEDLGDLLLDVLPPEGSTMGNASAREALSRVAERLGHKDVSTTMIYTHVPNRGPLRVHSPADFV
jgi:hypothetical protein